ncbi:MAG: ATP-binding cassette domain-containing protein [Chloroflexi bacterium]|nr:ATP-binding cassette domain-containing protein [Chloroflexota bacterium]
MKSDAPLELRKVTKVFGGGNNAVTAVKDVDLLVKRGELLLIMGPSGSGKTTLLTMAGCLLRPTSGTVLIDGMDTTRMSDRELSKLRQRSIGFVFQSFNLLSALTAQQNVEVSLNLAGRNGLACQEESARSLDNLGLAARRHFRPEKLSGGEKQRVSIARALVKDPDIVLADEPTANLDSRRGREIVEVLKAIAGGRGKAVIVVSHDHRIRELADRVMWLEDGRLEEMKVHRDPVCGMEIDPARASRSLTHNGVTYYFCAEGCQRLFAEDPNRFLKAG